MSRFVKVLLFFMGLAGILCSGKEIKVVKYGECPIVVNDTISTCIDMCLNDIGCGSNMKCCFNGCGHECREPVDSTPSVPKEGYCPVSNQDDDIVGICSEMCVSDIDCAGSMKCCSNGCGRVCVEPLHEQVPKEGYCPVSNQDDDIVGLCSEMCVNDTDCAGSMKCCSNGCGHLCMQPLYEQVIKPGICRASLTPEGASGICIEACEHDGYCTGNQKCCSNGCGHMCMDAVTEEPLCPDIMCLMYCEHGYVIDANGCDTCMCKEVHSGECPVTSSEGVGICIESCSHDGNCSTNEKCCSNGCGHTCMAVQEESTAPPNMCSYVVCRMYCPGGFKKDENGCSMCECLEVHSGECPVTSSEGVGICIESCSHDGNCSTNEKCCSNGCGHTCMTVQEESTVNPGTCPVENDLVGNCIDYVDSCLIDDECGLDEKCCPDPCGRKCKAPYKGEVGKLSANDNGCGIIAASFVTVCLTVLSSLIAL